MIKTFECFGGYGGWSFGLKKANIPFFCIGYSEIDKYAIQCYEQNHRSKCKLVSGITQNNDFNIKNYGDITKINPNELPNFDLLCASPPCQSFSVAGKGLGEDDSRGRLFENTIEIMRVKQPKYAIYENVKGLISKKHTEYFSYIMNLMKSAGYSVFWKILNTKEHGVPQNRERVFIVCIRQDIDPIFFKFPETEELKIFLKDILEDEVDEKYYLSENHINRLLKSTDIMKGFSKINPDVTGTQTSRQYANWKGTFVFGNVNPSNKGMNGNVYGGDIAPTLTTNKGEGNKIIQINPGTGKGNRIYDPDGTSVQKDNYVLDMYTIRKLTPKECFRLQGFMNDEIDTTGISDSQKYKLAGNGLSINVVAKIMKNLLGDS